MINLPLFFTRGRHFAPQALIVFSAILAVASYLQALNYPLISDDVVYITENTKLASLRLTELWHLFLEPYNPFEFLPVRDISYWFDITLFGVNPAAFRLHNIILFLLCLPLVYGTTSCMWKYFYQGDAAKTPWASAVVTALFSLHPGHVEAVVWISSRKDVLSTMFSLLALWLTLLAKREHGLSAWYAATALVSLFAAMLSKATALSLAPLIALIWLLFWLDSPKSERRSFQLLWPLASLLLAVCVVLIFIANSTVREPSQFGFEIIIRALAVLGWMARLAITPESRHLFYPVFDDTHLSTMVALGTAVLVASSTCMILIMRKRSIEIFSLIAFLLLCIPYMQLVPYKTFSLVSDRFLSLTVLPAILLVVAISWRFKPVLRTFLLIAIALPWSIQTIERPQDWRSFESLIDADLRANPGYYMPAFFKIRAFQLQNGMYREALDTASNIVDPEARNIMIKLINGYAATIDSKSTGKPQEAMARLLDLGTDLKQLPAQAKWNTTLLYFWIESKEMLANLLEYLARIFPDDMLVRYNIGLWMLDDSRFYEVALVYLREAAESHRLPESVRGQAFYNLGLALIYVGQTTEAEAPLRAALEQSPPDMRANCLLSSLSKTHKQYEDAARNETECNGITPIN